MDEIKKIMLNKPINLLLGDCLELLKNIPSNTVDLAFVDPPYNMQLDSTFENSSHTTGLTFLYIVKNLDHRKPEMRRFNLLAYFKKP